MSLQIVLHEGPPGEQIKAQIRGFIATNELPAGTRLPSVRQLARDLGIAAGTVAKAYQDLEAQGLLSSRRGSGTRVADGVTRVPIAVVEHIHALAKAAKEEGVGLDDVAHVLHALWEQA
ncbi:MAG TPA: GntR family transcriptional regulator [Beutenbergiaceae bacterium]|nr:GntR family transcriptional regulator [Beutenbergiaceae bacterium]